MTSKELANKIVKHLAAATKGMEESKRANGYYCFSLKTATFKSLKFITNDSTTI